MGTPDETTVWIGLDIGKTGRGADVLDEAGSTLDSTAPSRDLRAWRRRRASLARSPSATRHWSSTSPAIWPGSCSPLPPAADVPVAYVLMAGHAPCRRPLPGPRPTPTAATRSCWPTPAARVSHQVHWLDAVNDELPGAAAAFSTSYDTDLAADATAASTTTCGMRSPVFPRPWSAYWAANSTMRGHGTCSPASRHRRRWPRRVAAASRGRSVSARRCLEAALT